MPNRLEKNMLLLGSSLGNREIRKQESEFAHIFKKYNRKYIAQYALTVGNIVDNFLEKRRIKKTFSTAEFKLKEKNDISLKKINRSLCSCGIQPHLQNISGIVDIKESGKTRRLQGLKSCGSNSACPVCAAKLSAIRGKQLTELMSVGRNNGRSYMMIVSTIPHKAGEPLESTLNQVIDMSRYIFNQRAFKEFKELTECYFVHGGLENMVSFKNGKVDWHPHKNYLLDFNIKIDEILEKLNLKHELELRLYVSRLMSNLAQKFLNFKKIDKKVLEPFLYQDEKTQRIHVKGGVTSSLEFDDAYVTKWGLEAEMTAGVYKDGEFGSSFHPFVLLDYIDKHSKELNDKQRFQCIKAFQEFVVASRGKWWFYFAAKSINFYNEKYDADLNVKKDEIELLELEDIGELIYSLTKEEWDAFEPDSKKIGFALSLPTRKDLIEYIFTEIEKNRCKNSF